MLKTTYSPTRSASLRAPVCVHKEQLKSRTVNPTSANHRQFKSFLIMCLTNQTMKLLSWLIKSKIFLRTISHRFTKCWNRCVRQLVPSFMKINLREAIIQIPLAQNAIMMQLVDIIARWNFEVH